MSEAIGQCSCGGDIVETEKTYRCRECGKYVFKSIFWKKISKKDAVKLLNDEHVLIKGLKSKKKNKNFDATVYLYQEGDYWKVGLEFPESSEENDSEEVVAG